jgi:chromosome segregation ATPase
MAHPTPAPAAGDAPLVRLELRHGAARPSWHDVAGEEFLIGSVPGCDLRIPGSNLPPVIAQVVRRADGVRLRKLAPTLPVFVNGQPVVTQASLAHGDVIQIGALELHVQLALPTPQVMPASPGVSFIPLPQPSYTPPPAPEPANVWQQYQQEVTQFRAQTAQFEQQQQWLEEREQQIEQKHRQLVEHERELESDRVIWYQRREQIERECRELAERAASMGGRRHDSEQQYLQQRAAIDVERQTLTSRQQQVHGEARQVQDLRVQLQNRERELDTHVRDFTARVQAFRPRLQELEEREKSLAPREAELTRASEALAKEKLWHDTRLAERQRQLDAREAEVKAREQRFAVDGPEVQQMKARYESDLVRLDRQSAGLEQREHDVLAKAAEVERRYQQMQRDAHEMEEQARLLDGGQLRMQEEAARLAKQKGDQEQQAAELNERTATLEGQQAMLATLRTRLERMRDELRQQAAQVASERANHEDIALQIKQRLEEADRLKGDLDAENKNREQERATFDQRNAALHAAVLQMRSLQEKLEADDARIRERTEQLDKQSGEQAEQAAMLRARAQQMIEFQQRIEADRKSIREREASLTQAEEARKALQEQLIRRSEELATRSKALDDRSDALAEKEAEITRGREQVELDRKKDVEAIEGLRKDAETRSEEIQRLHAALNQREENVRRQVDRLKESGQGLSSERKLHFETKTKWEAEQANVAEQIAKARKELDEFRSETLKNAGGLAQQLPEVELRSQGAIERLAASREQLRGHLQELHSYSRQSQEDLQELRAQVQAEADRLRQQELALHRARSEHRLAVTAFRQQLIDWQGRVGELKQFFTQNESRLELKQQALEAAAKEIDETNRNLSRQAETLQQQRREVAERKGEVERHLGDMRDWYRKKMREIAGGPPRNYSGAVLEMPAANAVNDPAPPKSNSASRDILSLTGDVDPADRKLGELLLQLGLVEEETLIPLWNEARRQRRTLRQVLLSSGAITLYQLALIEAGNVEGLVLGPYRVIDRVQATPREMLYRVFDAARGAPALLRHLAESEMADAVRPDEYRQRFAAAVKAPHPNLAATYAVLDINGRPAALQEWVTGLPSLEWPNYAAAPGVWYRLLGQAGLGMQTAHNAGLTHGHLQGQNVILTADGTLKLLGFGEPAWLSGTGVGDSVASDLQALGRLACEWSMLMPSVKRGKARPLPEALQNIIRRLGAASFNGVDKAEKPVMLFPFDEHERYASVTAMLEELDVAGADLPPNAEAWDRLVKHVSENATEGAALRRTA